MKVAFVLCNDMHMDIDKANIFMNYVKRRPGIEITSDYTIADIVVVYMCAFGIINKEKSAEILADVLLNSKKDARVIATGCMIKTNYEDLSKIGGIEILEFEDILKMFSEKVEAIEPIVVQNTVIISEGCRYKCSYCLYSNLCKEYKSKPFDDVYHEVEILDKTESTIYITGAQETSSYGYDINNGKPMIETLMDTLATDFPKTNFVIGWFHPAGLTDKMISILEKHKNIVEIMLHIQHVDDELLKAMNRPSFIQTNSKINRLKTVRPDIRISTEIIVGFPGETLEKFNKLFPYLDKGYFDDIGVATYEPVPGTPASELAGKVDFIEASRRMQIIQNMYNATIYPTQPNLEIDFDNIFDKLMNFPKKILNDSQVYQDIANTDTEIKLWNFKNHLNKVFGLIINSRTKFEFSKNRKILIDTYTPEARELFLSIIQKGDFKQALVERARELLK